MINATDLLRITDVGTPHPPTHTQAVTKAKINRYWSGNGGNGCYLK